VFRWFVGLGMDDPVWDASTFCHNRDRLLEADISALVLNGVIEHRKVRESRLCFMGHALMENRNGLVVGGNVTIASGTAEREAALELIDRHCPGKRRRTLRRQPAYPQADRGDLRLGQNPKRPGQDPSSGDGGGSMHHSP
jgi:hypothetical protein